MPDTHIKPRIAISILLVCSLISGGISCKKDSKNSQEASGSDSRIEHIVAHFREKHMPVTACHIGETSRVYSDSGRSILDVEVSSKPECHIPYDLNGHYAIFQYDNHIIDILKLTNIREIHRGEGSVYIGGYEINSRNKSRFNIYDFRVDTVIKVFETKDVVYNNSLDCESYCNNGFLHAEFTDLNRDSIPDISFKGQVCFYCEGLESGYSRLDREPVHKRDTLFKYTSTKNSRPIRWRKEE